MGVGEQEEVWAYRLMWIVSVTLFTAAVWVPLVFAGLPQSQWVEQRLVIPQVKIVLTLAPPLAEKWPGPFTVPLREGHRWILAIAYGLVGWFSGWLIFRADPWWSSRIAWLLAAWLGYTGFLFFVGKLISMM